MSQYFGTFQMMYRPLDNRNCILKWMEFRPDESIRGCLRNEVVYTRNIVEMTYGMRSSWAISIESCNSPESSFPTLYVCGSSSVHDHLEVMTTYNRARAYLYALKETFPTITFVDGAGNDIDMSELEGVYSCCGSSYPLFSRDAIEESDIVTICAKCVTAVNTCEICGSRYRGEYCTNCFSRAKCDFCGVTTLCRIEDYAGNHVYLCPKHTKARKVQLMRHDFKPMFSYRRSIRCHA